MQGRLPARYVIAVLSLMSWLILAQLLPAGASAQVPSTPHLDQDVVPFAAEALTGRASASPLLPNPFVAPTLLASGHGPLNQLDMPTASSGEDRDNSTPTAWWIYTGQTDQDIANFVSSSNARIVDMDVDTSVLPFRYTVTYVLNSGAYESAWWYYLNVTASEAFAAAQTNNARLTVLKAYQSGGQTRLFAVMVPNSGSRAKSWWFYIDKTVSDLTSLWQANNARIVQVSSYETGAGKRYAAIMIGNTGADTSGWWWYVNADPSAISAHLSANSARLIDIDYDEASSSYNAVMVSCSAGCPSWWWYVGVPFSKLLPTIDQDGARPIDFNAFPCGSGTCFSMVLINNSNAETTRVGEMLRNYTDGTVGLYLKQVGGPVLASLMDGSTFEPASTIKVATHLYTYRQVAAGSAGLGNNITKYAPPASGSCPGSTPIGVETIDVADREMMWHSDNTRTRELNDHWGVSSVNAVMAGAGMSRSAINHVVGCGGPIENTTTLDDLGRLYEGVADGTLLKPAERSAFYGHMAGKAQFAQEGYDWTGVWTTDLPAIISKEAPAGMPASLKAAFLAKMDLAYKAGNYKICTNVACTTYKDHISIFGWASVPNCTATAKGYVFGLYVYGATSDAGSAQAFNLTKAELLRGPIHDGLSSCFHRGYLPEIRR